MKRPFTNHKKHTVYVGGLGVPPGDTRMVDAEYIDPPKPVATEPEPDPVRELLELPVVEIEAAVSNPDAPKPVELLEAALAVEQMKSKPRRGAVKAIEAALKAATEAAIHTAAGEAEDE